MFKARTGVDILHIPYKGSGPAVSDLLAGQVDMMIDTGSLAQVQALSLIHISCLAAAGSPP